MAGKFAVAVVGPTCTGKTGIAIDLAKLLGGEIVSADSRQIYKLATIGTAKPSPEELSEVPHHLVDILPLDEQMSAGAYSGLARKVVGEVFIRGRTPIIVGGSGLYLRALIDGLFEAPEVDDETGKSLRDRLRSEGAAKLLEELRNVDPKAAEGLLPQNYKRILRALEIYYSSGKRISELREANPDLPDFRTLQFGVRIERKDLYRLIEDRVDSMIEKGLVDEVREILRRGFDPKLNSLQTVGYKEVISYLQQRITFDEMVAQIKMNTRRYAKRQMTWFRKDSRIIWIESDGKKPEVVAGEIYRRISTADMQSR